MNTLPVGQGLNTVLKVVVNGAAATGACFTISASDVIIKGLVINNCDIGVAFTSGAFDTSKVEGCFLGTDAAGGARVDQNPNKQIEISGQSGAVIGGTTAAARNLISGCLDRRRDPQRRLADGALHPRQPHRPDRRRRDAVLAPAVRSGGGRASRSTGRATSSRTTPSRASARGSFSSGTTHTVRGNFIGTDASGTVELGIEDEGIQSGGSDHTIGGTAAGDGNVIAGAQPGVSLGGANNTVYGNFLGTDTTGTLDLGNDTTGITMSGSDNIVGGTGAGQANIIAFNGANQRRAACP